MNGMNAVREWKELHNKKFHRPLLIGAHIKTIFKSGNTCTDFLFTPICLRTQVLTHKFIICAGVKLGVSYYGKNGNNTECGRLTRGIWEEETAFADF